MTPAIILAGGGLAPLPKLAVRKLRDPRLVLADMADRTSVFDVAISLGCTWTTARNWIERRVAPAPSRWELLAGFTGTTVADWERVYAEDCRSRNQKRSSSASSRWAASRAARRAVSP